MLGQKPYSSRKAPTFNAPVPQSRMLSIMRRVSIGFCTSRIG